MNLDQLKSEDFPSGKKETCPGCGLRKRWIEHPVCPDCNKRFIEEGANSLLEGNVVTRMEWVKKQGEKTLERLKKELEESEAKQRELQKPFWDEAHQEVVRILNGKRVEKVVFNRTKGKKFEEAWRTSSESKIDKRVYGLKKAIESLSAFLSQ